MAVVIEPKPANIANRIVELKMVPSDELMEHPHNWRTHPASQLELLKHSIHQFGLSDALLAYYSARNGNKLTLFDGHARLSMPDVQIWPVLVTDLTDDEADMMLMLVDPISALATVDPDNLMTLASNADVTDPVLASFCLNMANQHIAKPKDEPKVPWPAVHLQLPPDEFQHWLMVVVAHGGDALEGFRYLLSNIDPAALVNDETEQEGDE